MKTIAFLTELPFEGGVPDNHDNMRTEFAWMNALRAVNIPIVSAKKYPENFCDLVVIIVPKTLENFIQYDIIGNAKRIGKKVAFMQEGPSWYYQDLKLDLSFEFFNIMNQCDFSLAHNECDKRYYEGLLTTPSYINPTLMIETLIKDLPTVERKNVMVGGNFGKWYGGWDSYVVALEFDTDIYMPSMGRMKEEEKHIDGINHLPYCTWVEWIRQLHNFKYAVHLNPNTIGGTFYLNCAYLGIPCIGNQKANTQRLCFPDLSVDTQDLVSAKAIAHQLKTDSDFYNECSDKAKKLYDKNFSLDSFMTTWDNILNKVFTDE